MAEAMSQATDSSALSCALRKASYLLPRAFPDTTERPSVIVYSIGFLTKKNGTVRARKEKVANDLPDELAVGPAHAIKGGFSWRL
ncbi:hypothetical protein [Paraburkholderia youngii]|uniref:hypothetical protein n=1 Tax=Paraburkholderia youngii TaxID=2782701 RepID=UPI001591F79B|nr:hypothetical protein [Paraburkholderia youngii]NUX55491.1 hypothetical protein [Paraburkholderia youngii]